jgi:hypothetical protein
VGSLTKKLSALSHQDLRLFKIGFSDAVDYTKDMYTTVGFSEKWESISRKQGTWNGLLQNASSKPRCQFERTYMHKTASIIHKSAVG